MILSDVITLPDGKVFYLLSSDEEPEVYVGDVLIDCKGNRYVITGVGEATKCFGDRYSFSLMLDGKAEQGKANILMRETQG